MTLWEEILSQPRVLERFVEERREEVQDVADWIASRRLSYLVIAARGSSDNAARYAEYLWGAHNRMSVALAAPSLYTLYDSPPDLEGSLVLAISQSGESPDILAVLAEATAQGRPTVAITNNPDSPLGRAADRHLDLGAGEETAVAATKSYTSQLLMVAALSAALTGGEEPFSALRLVPDAVARSLELTDAIDAGVEALVGQTRCVVIGRGYNHSTADEWALKIAELAYLVAQPFSAADFRHGPMAMAEEGLVVLGVATSGPLFADVADLLEEVGERGARTVVISDREDCPADHLIRLPHGVPEWLSPIPVTVAAQVFSYRLAIARGLDPDNPRGLSKVTRTI